MPDGSNKTQQTALTSPLKVYQAQIGHTLVDDPSQLAAIKALDDLFHQFTAQKSAKLQTIKGLYLWGDVGRGKTYLMDLFFDCLPNEGKMRLHFHRFMARINQALNAKSGQQDPLNKIAHELAQEIRIICFDEFFVSDIADAMILAGLFDSLFKQGVVLVATSNIPIERLYENGLARHKFLPCIAILQQHTHMIQLDGKQDHRLNTFSNSVLKPFSSANIGLVGKHDFSAIFTRISQNTEIENLTKPSHISVCHRQITVINVTESKQHSIVWFDFNALCEGPRSPADYIEIASRFDTVMLSNVPQLGGELENGIKARGTEDGVGENQATETGERIITFAKTDNAARRLISLIDELYDQKVTLYLSCQVPLHELYLKGALIFEFRRTYSRLMEMSQAPLPKDESYIPKQLEDTGFSGN